MKISTKILFFIGMATMLSCHKDNFNYPAGTVGISKIVFFPTVALKGNALIIIQPGSSFTEPGVDAQLGGKATTFTTTGTVGTAPGVYILTYTAANPQGYTASASRTVVIIGNDVGTNDYSGTYTRAATGVSSTWTKTANGVYTVENPGGAAVGAGLTVVAVNYTGNKITIPSQNSPDYGPVSSANETYSTGPPAHYSWVFFAGGYGTGLRT